MDSKKYIGMDVHKESISIAVMNGAGKIVMEGVIETKASMMHTPFFKKKQHLAALPGLEENVPCFEVANLTFLFKHLQAGSRKFSK